MSRLALMAVLAAGAIGLAGCGSGEEEEAAPEEEVAEDTADDPAEAEEEEGDAAADAGAGDAVAVTAVEMGFEGLPESVPAGTVEFELTNGGSMPHDLVIEEIGDQAVVSQIDGGDTASGTVDLEPGTYTLYCSVGDHRAAGMEATLVVE